MDESEHSIFTLNAETNEYSLPVRAGRRTYFFYVKRTRDADPFVVITESRRVGTDSEGKSSYEKSRLHLYKEDFEKFSAALAEVTDHVAALPEPRQQTDKQHVSTPPPPRKKRIFEAFRLFVAAAQTERTNNRTVTK